MPFMGDFLRKYDDLLTRLMITSDGKGKLEYILQKLFLEAMNCTTTAEYICFIYFICADHNLKTRLPLLKLTHPN